MIELTEEEQRTLKCVVNNPDIKRSDLTRRMHSIGVDNNDKQLIIDILQVDHKLITSKPESFSLAKRGRRAQIYSATKKGKDLIVQIIIDNKKAGH